MSSLLKKPQIKTANIDIIITDLVLTPLSCACLVNQIIKCLVYQKSQIPYPYNWLESVINRKRKNVEVEKKINFTAQNHYKVASSAYDTLEEIMKNISMEFSQLNSNIQEILIIFGSTPYCAKEIFTLKIPTIARGHIEANHINITLKNQHKILRKIFLSNEWMAAMENSILSTNTYVMLKKESINTSNNFFLLNRDFTIPNTVKNTIISLNYEDVHLCCDNLQVYEDGTNNLNNITNRTCINISDDIHWYQAKSLLKGFKDCFVNKISASELW